MVFSKLKSNSFFAKPTKYEYGPIELEHLGYIILKGTVKPAPKKAEAI